MYSHYWQVSFTFKNFIFIYLLYLWPCWACAVARAFLQLWCAGFSLSWLLLCGAWAREHRLSSRGTRVQLFRGMWDLFGPEIEPVPRAYGIFLDQRLNPGLLYWQAGKPDTYTGRIVLNKYLITLQFKFLDCSLICSENPQVALLVRIYTLP